MIPRKDDAGNETEDYVIYRRAYYELALEVLFLLLSLMVVKTILQNSSK